MNAIPYLNYNGNCEDAMLFYQSVIGGEAQFIRFSELPSEENIPVSEAWQSKIMHGTLILQGGGMVFFGDTWENSPVVVGSNNTVHLTVDSEADVSRIVGGLSVGGKVTMPPDRTFWGSAYGSLIDRYGVHWGVEYPLLS